MRKLTALFTACLMAAAMMVPAFAADVEEIPEIVIEVDGEEELQPRNAELCNCGGALRIVSGPNYDIRIKLGGQKYPNRMCRHGNPQHMVVDREEVITVAYRCDRCKYEFSTRTARDLSPDCVD